MRIRGLVSLAIATISISACVRVAGRDQPTETNGAEPATKWTPARTPDGQPDIQGIWTNYTNTPFAVFDEKDQPGLYSGDPDGTGRGTGPGFINDSFERKLSKGRSLVVDPPSGRVPIMPWAEEKRKKDPKREEKVLAKLREICLGLPQAREVKTWRPTCRRSRVTQRRGAKARRQCRQGLRLPGKNSFRRPIRGWLRYPGGGGPISWWRPNQHESSQGIQGLRHERYGFETRRPGYGIQRYACRRSHYRFRNSERQR